MRQNHFKIVLGIVTFIADSAMFNSLIEIRMELFYFFVVSMLLSVFWLIVCKVRFGKIEPTSKSAYILIISVITLSSMGVSVLTTPKEKDYSKMVSLSKDELYIDSVGVKYADLGFDQAQLAISGTYMQHGDINSEKYNPTKALEYALLGAINGDTTSLMNAALFYFNGLGTEVNYDRAYYLMSIAKKNGSKGAPIFMNSMIHDNLIDTVLLRNIGSNYAYGDSAIFKSITSRNLTSTNF